MGISVLATSSQGKHKWYNRRRSKLNCRGHSLETARASGTQGATNLSPEHGIHSPMKPLAVFLLLLGPRSSPSSSSSCSSQSSSSIELWFSLSASVRMKSLLHICLIWAWNSFACGTIFLGSSLTQHCYRCPRLNGLLQLGRAHSASSSSLKSCFSTDSATTCMCWQCFCTVSGCVDK